MVPESHKKVAMPHKWRILSRPFTILLVLVLMLFGSALQYSFSEREESEEIPISFLVSEAQEVSRKEKQIPVHQEKRINQDGDKVFSGNLEALHHPPHVDLASRWLETDKIRDPPVGCLSI